MPLETATTIADLVTSNPAASDGMNNADDHMRMIKGVLKNTFPGVNVPLTRTTGPSDTYAGLIAPSGLSTAPGYAFVDEPTLGFYRSASGLILIAGGQLSGNGAVPMGTVHQFLYEPPKLGKLGNAIAGMEYLELDGAVYNTADYPRLAAAMGATGSTFTVKNVTDTGRFLRSRMTGLAVGTTQANAFKTHAIVASGTTAAGGSHAHNVSGSTGLMDRNDPHAHTYLKSRLATVGNGLPGGDPWGLTSDATATDAISVNHAHVVSGSTDAQGTHAHAVTVTGTATGDTETRPEALAVIICVKT